MQPPLKTRLQLELLKKIRSRKASADKGFTLIELIIVVAVIGLLAAVGLPQFIGARARASAAARVGEAIGLARECAADQINGATSLVGNQTCGGGAAVTFSGTFLQRATGVRCLDKTAASGNQTVSVAVSTDGVISCEFS